MEWKNHRLMCFINKTPLFYCGLSIIFIFIFFTAFTFHSTTVTTKTTPFPDRRIRSQMTNTKAYHVFIQEFEKLKGGEEKLSVSKLGKSNEVFSSGAVMAKTRRRFLSGPGSWPPRCMSKCGRCAPCKPVHVTVAPGNPVTTEYYPEAWRCKCGNRLFMP